MPNAEQINLLDQKYPQLKNVKNNHVSVLEKVRAIEMEHTDSNFTLLKRFLKELQLANNNLLRTYNREVI